MNKLAAALLLALTGCAADSDGALHISGQLADASRVTHVVATNAVTGDHVLVDLKDDGNPDGRFSVDLPSGEGAWVVTFADASQRGEAMRIATLQSGGVDAFESLNGGTLELGTINFDGHYAHGTMTWESLAKVMGMSVDDVKAYAKTDDLALRYSNPDIDNNGQLDALEGHGFVLDFSGSYRFQVGNHDAVISDLVRGIRPSLRYTGTAIVAGVPSDMGMNMPTGTVQFDQPFYGTVYGSDTPAVAAGVHIGQPHVKFGALDGSNLIGVGANAKHDAPRGSYNFGFSNGTLTFSDVLAPTAATLQAASDYAVPFVRIRPTNPQCTTNCDIESIDLEWMRQVDGVWTAVTEPRDAQIDIVAHAGGKQLNLSGDIKDGATSLPWSQMPVTGTGLVRSELAYISTAELCYFAVSYRSELGMKMTGQVINPGCF